MKRLIINADDYGRSPDISRGIREAHRNGVVTSTTCMMNIPTTAEDIALALKATPGLRLGVHLVLTMGRPLSGREAVSSMVDGDGKFHKYGPFVENLPNLKVDQVKAEWRLQIERFIRTAGCSPTHLDSHHHTSYFSPGLFRAMLELAREYDCAIRYPFESTDNSREFAESVKHLPQLMKEFTPRRPDRFLVDFYDEGATRETLLDMIKNMADGTNELMCHPGYVDQAFADNESIYNFQRERELKILTDPAVRQAIEMNGIELIAFTDLNSP